MHDQIDEYRLKFEQDLAREKGLPIPTELPKPDEDPYFYFSLQQKNEKLRERIEKYLSKNNEPGTEFGRTRQRYMVDLYNKVNNQMEELAYHTGITTYPPRKCSIINDKYSIKFENKYADRYTFETKGVNPEMAYNFVKTFKDANKQNYDNSVKLNVEKEAELKKNQRYKELLKKVDKKQANAEEQNEYNTLRNNAGFITGYKEKDIGTARTKYADPNTEEGRTAPNPTFGGIFTELRNMNQQPAAQQAQQGQPAPQARRGRH